MNLKNTHFLQSAHNIQQLPNSVAEVAFAGRSNAGKSTAINKITNQTGLAKVSKTPGRTQLLNFFQVTDKKFLVDLPGYGFAKVPAKLQIHWLNTMRTYLETRPALKGIILLMDIRHPLTDLDIDFISLLADFNLSTHIVLTKADKLNRSPALQQQQKVISTLKNFNFTNIPSVQLLSSLKNIGVTELENKILDLLDINNNTVDADIRATKTK